MGDALTEILKYAVVTLIGGYTSWYFLKRKSKEEVEDEKRERDSEMYKQMGALLTSLTENSKTTTEVSKTTAEQLLAKIIQVDELGRKFDDLNLKYQNDLLETQRLRSDYANAQKQIIKQQEQITHHEKMIISLGEYIEVQNTAMKEAGITVDVHGDFKALMDSVHSLKATRK